MKFPTFMVVVTIIAIIFVVGLTSGCVSTARLERGTGENACRAVVQGSFFAFWAPAVIEECRPEVK